MESNVPQKGFSGERLVWIFFVLVLLVLGSFFSIKAYRLQTQVYDTSKQLLALDIRLTDAQETTAQLQQMLDMYTDISLQLKPTLSDSELTDYMGKGIQDPYKDIPADLIKHPELIPFKGELGGTYGFYSASKIFVLGPHRVWAYVEDGHNSKALLLDNDVSDDGTIKCTVIGRGFMNK